MTALQRVLGRFGVAAAAATAPAAGAAANVYFRSFDDYFAYYERRFRDVAITKAPNGSELRLIRAGWDDHAVRSLLDEVLAGKLSATAALVRLGWVEERSPTAEMRSAWRRAGPAHKAAFVAEFADELRALLSGDQGSAP